MQPAIECNNLALNYGKGTRIGPLSLQIESGSCVALVGPNGAGKSSFINMVLGLRPPSEGECKIHGEDSANPSSRRNIGYLPEVVEFPPKSRAWDLIGLHAGLCDVENKSLQLNAGQNGPSYLKEFGLQPGGKRLGAFSKGMKQRLGLSLAMMDCQRLLVLDEPNSGLDPVGISQMRKKMEECKQNGVTILWSTHRLAEIMPLADRILIMHQGEIAGDRLLKEFNNFQALEQYFLEQVS